jgi:hypothetical protein
MRRELISNALKERFSEVCNERIPHLDAAGGASDFLLDVRAKVSNISPADARNLILHPRGLDRWTTSAIGCLRSLMALSLGAPLELREGERPPVEPFIKLLSASRADHEHRRELLLERYGSPLNITFPAEALVREHILTRLMVQDRALVEKGAGGTFNTDDLLMKLNLVAVVAARTTDLRFLDALNYYYELLPAWSQSPPRDDALLASYLALYAQALAAQM